MACSLIEHKRINTTVAKAKALRQFVEPLITKAKPDNNVTAEKGTHNRRIVFRNLRDKYAVTELFGTVAEKIADRPGGYTRIIKLGNRLGDNADMAMIELVDFNEIYNAGKAKKKTTRRSRRGKSEDKPVTEPVEETKVDAGKTEEPKADKGAEVEAKKEPAAKKESEAKVEKAEETEATPEKEAVSEEKAETKADEKPEAEAAEKPEAEAKSDAKDDAETKKDDNKE